jgi:iron complex outermembrane receptor protein
MFRIALPAWAIVSAVALVAVLPTPASAQEEGRIEGVILVGSAPVDDADVLVPGLGRRVRADAAGRFMFDRVPPGRYVVEAQSVRWGRGLATVDVTAGAVASVTVRVEAVFHLDEMVVSAGVGSTQRSEAYQPASVLTSRDLVTSAEASLGETLSRQPGVSSTYFGPGASRPIIRGIGGDRVRILEAGIGTGDASSTSPDHAVAVEARASERIEVIRGPATLLYGSSAVGGIVNVFDERIARDLPTQPLTGYFEGLAGSVSDERTGSGAVNLTTGRFVVSASGLWRDASDYSIPGFAELDPEPGEDPVEGILENSWVENRRGSAGLTYVAERGYAGVAVSTQRSDYGVPGHAHHEETVPPPPGAEEEEEFVSIDLEQTRIDFEGALRFGASPVRNLKARFGYTDYNHVELEGEEIGTQFLNDYFEGRLESEHSFSARTQGALGAQFSARDFEAIGDEAFVPPSTTQTSALFGYEEFRWTETLNLQGGVRVERQRAESPGVAELTLYGVSGSLGANWDANELVSFAASASRSMKLPNAEELFSNGPHAATRAYEIGDPLLESEVALGFDLTTHIHAERFRASASIFTTGFADYIYQEATGAERDGLTEYRYVQGDARFTGAELEAAFDVIENDPSMSAPHLTVEMLADFVNAKLTDTDEYLPRIPPMRLGGGLRYRQGAITAHAGARWSAKQDRLGPFETETAAFTMVDASISYRLVTGGLFHDITLTGSNLTDVDARMHTSFLKDMAPLPGREIRLIYRINFGGL